jgi:hypothetical protein
MKTSKVAFVFGTLIFLSCIYISQAVWESSQPSISYTKNWSEFPKLDNSTNLVINGNF